MNSYECRIKSYLGEVNLKYDVNINMFGRNVNAAV